jgi:hypothetical protein
MPHTLAMTMAPTAITLVSTNRFMHTCDVLTLRNEVAFVVVILVRTTGNACNIESVRLGSTESELTERTDCSPPHGLLQHSANVR